MVEEKVSSLCISDASIIYADKRTVNQSESMTWHMLREGRLTGSRVHSVLHTDQVKPSLSLIKRICAKSSVRSTSIPSLKWGIDHEKIAIAQFTNYQSTQGHVNPAISQSGLVIKKEFPFLAASPDGLYMCSCHDKALIEVKCPYSLRESENVEEAIESGTFYLDKDCLLKKSHSYYTQVQHQLYVCDYKKCYFIVWTPQWMQITLIDRDDEFIQGNLPKLINFFKVHLMPELLTRRLEDKEKEIDAETDKLFCFCNSPYNGDEPWIGCDSANCPKEWFHLSCVGIKRIPKGNWYCKLCKKQKKQKK